MLQDSPGRENRWVPELTHRVALLSTARLFLAIGFALGLMMAGILMLIWSQI